MTCERIRFTRPVRKLSDDYLMDFGDEIKAQWLKTHGLDEVRPAKDHWVIMCGSWKPSPQCRCGRLADILCDEPVGAGKTCDMACCTHCAREIGEDQHLCPLHASRHPVEDGVACFDPMTDTGEPFGHRGGV
jgi:hypothetical protein